MQEEKRRYLTLYDYKTGGVWTFIYARSADEILVKYPELRIMDEKAHSQNLYPANSSAEEKVKLEFASTFDIDDEPSGFLRTLMESR